jgi:hypothetical protein
MALKTNLNELLRDPGVGKLIHIIAENKRIRLNSLMEAASKMNVENPQANIALLKAESLIGEEPSTLDNFSTYYVTSEGLELDRKLRRMGLYSQTE